MDALPQALATQGVLAQCLSAQRFASATKD